MGSVALQYPQYPWDLVNVEGRPSELPVNFFSRAANFSMIPRPYDQTVGESEKPRIYGVKSYDMLRIPPSHVFKTKILPSLRAPGLISTLASGTVTMRMLDGCRLYTVSPLLYTSVYSKRVSSMVYNEIHRMNMPGWHSLYSLK
jgi:hypothetical protein